MFGIPLVAESGTETYMEDFRFTFLGEIGWMKPKLGPNIAKYSLDQMLVKKKLRILKLS